MTHLDPGTLQTFLDDELAAAERVVAESHIASCDPCAGTLRELRQAGTALTAAVALLDQPAPMLAARARLEDQYGRNIRGSGMFGMRLAPAALLRAAAVVVLVTGAASATIPGSPVRRWASGLWDRASRLFAEPTPSTAPTSLPVVLEPATPAPSSTEPTSGISAAPSNGSVQISLRSVADGARITIRYTDQRTAWVDALPTAGDPPQYRSGPGRIDVSGIEGAGVIISLPRGLSEVTIEIDGALYYSVRNGEERIYAPGAERAQDSITFLIRS